MRIPRTPALSSGRPTAASRCTPPRTRRSSSWSPGPTSSCRPPPGRGSRSSPSRRTRRASPGAGAPTTPPRSSDFDRLLDSADGNPLALVELPATLHQPGPTPDWMPVGELIVASFTARMSDLPARPGGCCWRQPSVTMFHSAKLAGRHIYARRHHRSEWQCRDRSAPRTSRERPRSKPAIGSGAVVAVTG